MSPILVRPVREQLEHDRVIRLLQAKSKRRYEAGMNPGVERNVAVGVGTAAIYPDLVLYSLERGRRLQAVVEVETGESVNHLEALAQWAHLSRLKTAFHLYVPSSMVEVARRLCEDNQITVTEIWSYHAVGDDVRFALVHREPEAAPSRASRARDAEPAATHDQPAKGKATPARRKAPKVKAKPPKAKVAAPVKKAAKPAKPAARPAKSAKAPRGRVGKASPRAARRK